MQYLLTPGNNVLKCRRNDKHNYVIPMRVNERRQNFFVCLKKKTGIGTQSPQNHRLPLEESQPCGEGRPKAGRDDVATNYFVGFAPAMRFQLLASIAFRLWPRYVFVQLGPELYCIFGPPGTKSQCV